jgi:phosphoribosylanthranilate isomerase
MTLVKICGITNLDDALAAVDAGADALGFNFYEKSPRYVQPETAQTIVEQLPASVLKVGVFVNVESTAMLKEMARGLGLGLLQLHGDESPEYCAELSEYPVMKALAVGEDFQPEEVSRYKVDSILLDTSDRNFRGGTGRTFNWTIAQRVRGLVPRLFLAGGLSPENVVEAVNLVQPFAVDTCSAVESSPGRKNHQRMRQFVQAVRDVKP